MKLPQWNCRDEIRPNASKLVTNIDNTRAMRRWIAIKQSCPVHFRPLVLHAAVDQEILGGHVHLIQIDVGGVRARAGQPELHVGDIVKNTVSRRATNACACESDMPGTVAAITSAVAVFMFTDVVVGNTVTNGRNFSTASGEKPGTSSSDSTLIICSGATGALLSASARPGSSVKLPPPVPPPCAIAASVVLGVLFAAAVVDCVWNRVADCASPARSCSATVFASDALSPSSVSSRWNDAISCALMISKPGVGVDTRLRRLNLACASSIDPDR